MPWSRPIDRRWALRSPSLACVRERARARAPRCAGLTEHKLRQLDRLEAATFENGHAAEFWMEAIGHDGGLWSWKSSPIVMWLSQQIAGQA
jgi:hypothetical protein